MQVTPLQIKSEKKKKKIKYYTWFLIPFLILLALLILLPFVIIIFYSLFKETSEFPIYRFTGENYEAFIKNSKIVFALFKSLWFAFIATIITLLISYPLAYFISKRSPKTQNLLTLLVTAPMWINMLLRILALKQIFDGPLLKLAQSMGYSEKTLLGSSITVIIGMVYIYIPYMVLPIYTILQKLDKRLIEASTDLGGKTSHTFLHVTLPLSLPGIMSGVTIVFLSSATTIAISKYLGGGKYNLIGNIIETEFITNSAWGYGSAISIILLAIIMLVMWVGTKISSKYEGGDE